MIFLTNQDSFHLLHGRCFGFQSHAIPDHKSALRRVIGLLHLDENSNSITAVGHRVVHGGESVNKPVLITEELKKAVEKSIPLAPLHNPPNLEV